MNENIISGWGLTNPVSAKKIFPKNIGDLENIVNSAKPKTIITRGLGRSYGDAAQLEEATIIKMDNFNHINLKVEKHEVTTGSGVTFDQLLKFIIPKGFFIPVSPGTRYVTIGGAISSDVHGKNHHVDGSFGNHVKSFLILNGNGEIKRLDKFSTKDIRDLAFDGATLSFKKEYQDLVNKLAKRTQEKFSTIKEISNPIFFTFNSLFKEEVESLSVANGETAIGKGLRLPLVISTSIREWDLIG